MTDDEPHIAAHRHSSDHRDELLRSSMCACFYCLERFPPGAIVEWIDGDRTAICPRCGIDSVIGDASGYSLDDVFIQRMHRHWFETFE